MTSLHRGPAAAYGVPVILAHGSCPTSAFLSFWCFPKAISAKMNDGTIWPGIIPQRSFGQFSATPITRGRYLDRVFHRVPIARHQALLRFQNVAIQVFCLLDPIPGTQARRLLQLSSSFLACLLVGPAFLLLQIGIEGARRFQGIWHGPGVVLLAHVMTSFCSLPQSIRFARRA